MLSSLSLSTVRVAVVSLAAGAAAAVSLAAVRDRPPIVVALPAAATGPTAPEPPGARAFTASGTATIEAVPDVAELVVTLEVERAQPRDAATLVRAKQDAMLAALTATGVARADIALSGLQLGQVHETVDPQRGTTRLRGHRATITMTLATRDFEAVAGLMQVAAETGASSVTSQFRVDDLPALKRKVRAMAAAAARDKARELGEALGVELGRVRAIVEQPGDGWGWNGTYANAVMIERATAPSHGSLQRITMTIDVTYELG